ncbi:hypothetical protein [Pelagibius sp.]|uniref:hypothetical protein n=1 Tax=Pelagibius sp. TaxID=1931238 RepID=UPI003B5100D9
MGPRNPLPALPSEPLAMPPAKTMTQTQIGTIGEVTVAAQLMLGSQGRFSPFLPFADDDGIDLIVYDKVTGRSLPVQVKARTSAKLGKSDTILFDVRRKTFSDHEGAFLLAILLDIGGGAIDRAWLIPMAELGSIARVKADKLSITPSAKDASKDRYTPYRCTDMAEVVQRLATYLDGRRAPPPS